MEELLATFYTQWPLLTITGLTCVLVTAHLLSDKYHRQKMCNHISETNTRLNDGDKKFEKIEADINSIKTDIAIIKSKLNIKE